MSKEPSVIIASITSAVTATLALLVAYGISVSPEQQTAILGVVAVAAPIVAAIIIRSNVWSPDSVQNAVDKAARTGTAPQVR